MDYNKRTEVSPLDLCVIIIFCCCLYSLTWEMEGCMHKFDGCTHKIELLPGDSFDWDGARRSNLQHRQEVSNACVCGSLADQRQPASLAPVAGAERKIPPKTNKLSARLQLKFFWG